jgi:hypothetical protein
VHEAAGELYEAQKEAVDILQDNLPMPPKAPKPAPKGKPKPALFDSDTEFVAATRRLIDDKKLSGSGDGDDDVVVQ